MKAYVVVENKVIIKIFAEGMIMGNAIFFSLKEAEKFVDYMNEKFTNNAEIVECEFDMGQLVDDTPHLNLIDTRGKDA